jgi:hypothetical protein
MAVDGQGGRRIADGKRGASLRETLLGWATPAARDWRDGRASPETMERNSRPLNEQAQLTGWATPAAHEAGGTPEAVLARKEAARERGAELGVSLTSLSLQAQLADPGPPPNGFSAATGKPGQLNPDFSRWLMGYPAAWGSCADTAMRSSPSKRRRSSGR